MICHFANNSFSRANAHRGVPRAGYSFGKLNLGRKYSTFWYLVKSGYNSVARGVLRVIPHNRGIGGYTARVLYPIGYRWGRIHVLCTTITVPREGTGKGIV
jgi:hypothetical protein